MDAARLSDLTDTRVTQAPRVMHRVSSWLLKVTVAALHDLCGQAESHCQFCENAGQGR